MYLEKVTAKFATLGGNQAGFRKGYRTTDHIFTLSSIITHFINAQKTEIFACFVDFKKAFDKVSHSLLWSKLIQIGIGGRFLNLLKAMYSEVKSCVRAGDGLTKASISKER